jgi:hypothetical protein
MRSDPSSPLAHPSSHRSFTGEREADKSSKSKAKSDSVAKSDPSLPLANRSSHTVFLQEKGRPRKSSKSKVLLQDQTLHCHWLIVCHTCFPAGEREAEKEQQQQGSAARSNPSSPLANRCLFRSFTGEREAEKEQQEKSDSAARSDPSLPLAFPLLVWSSCQKLSFGVNRRQYDRFSYRGKGGRERA